MDELTKAAATIKKHCASFEGFCTTEKGECPFYEKDTGCILMHLMPESWPVNTEDAE